MHSNSTAIKYASDLAMTTPTSLTGLISATPTRSKINLHDRKQVNTRVHKKAGGRRDQGSLRIVCEYEKTQHAAIEALHKGFTEKFWQTDYSDGAKDKHGNCLVTEFGPPEFNEDNILVTEFEITNIDGDDDFTTS